MTTRSQVRDQFVAQTVTRATSETHVTRTSLAIATATETGDPMLNTRADMVPFPASLRFPDVDDAILEAEDDAEIDMLTAQGPWQMYMSRVLAPEVCQ